MWGEIWSGCEFVSKKEVIKAADGVNILGICAGFQCLFRDSVKALEG